VPPDEQQWISLCQGGKMEVRSPRSRSRLNPSGRPLEMRPRVPAAPSLKTHPYVWAYGSGGIRPKQGEGSLQLLVATSSPVLRVTLTPWWLTRLSGGHRVRTLTQS
jgi:hypothetical protein